jgi:putative transcriptional regulator
MEKDSFEELLTSIRQGGDILKGKAKPSRVFNLNKPDIKGIRSDLGLSQFQFARFMGISLGTLRNWEQGHRKPQGPARVLLGVVALHPEVLVDLIQLTHQKTKKKNQKLAA